MKNITGGVVGISLPVRIFEARSMIERVMDWFHLFPIYIKKAFESTDPLHRLKCIISMGIGSLYIICRQLKPFNPLLGETY
jgi:hypothetical protein